LGLAGPVLLLAAVLCLFAEDAWCDRHTL